MRVISTACLSGLLLLGACHGSSAKTDSSTTTTATTTTGGATPAALAMPKPGLWEMSTTSDMMPQPVKIQVCLGTPPPGVNPFAPPKIAGQNCAKSDFTKTESGYTVALECKVNGMTMTSNGEVSGDFSSDYKTVMHTKIGGPGIPAAMQAEHASTVESKRLGDCPAGMAPGTAKQGA